MKTLFVTGWKCFLFVILLTCFVALNGCASTEKVLSGVDYACVDVSVDGPWTDSGIAGRGIVLPEGETLTAEAITALCEY
jgi:hypothetical protein